MSAARDLLADLDLIGAKLEPVGDRLILRAGPMAIPAGLVRRVREAKADLLVTLTVRTDHTVLRSDENSPRRQDEDRPFETLVVEWLNQHPTPSVPGHCAWCGRPESPSAMVLPFGNEPGTHTWLHAECWPAWHQARRADAVAALWATDPTLDRALVHDHDR